MAAAPGVSDDKGALLDQSSRSEDQGVQCIVLPPGLFGRDGIRFRIISTVFYQINSTRPGDLSDSCEPSVQMT